MISAFFNWFIGLFRKKPKPTLEVQEIDKKIEEKKVEVKQIEKEIEDVKERDTLDNNVGYFNNN